MSNIHPCPACGRPCWGERCAQCHAIIRPDEVTSMEMLALLGVTYRQADYWVTHILNRNPGTGRNRRFNLDELVLLKSVAILVNAGLNLQRATECAGLSEIRADGCTIVVDMDGIRERMTAAVAELRGAAA